MKMLSHAHIKAPAENRPKVVELDDEENAVSCPVTAAEIKACPEEYRFLVYRA